MDVRAVTAVGDLLDVDDRVRAEVTRRIVVIDGVVSRALAISITCVVILASDRRASCGEDPGFSRAELAIAVGITDVLAGIIILCTLDGGSRCDAGLVIGDDDIMQRDIAGVGHGVGPGDGIADMDVRAVTAVGDLLDMNARIGTEVAGRIVIIDGIVSWALAIGIAGIFIEASHCSA